MNSILRALLARWPLIAVTTLACLLGGAWVSVTSAPRYKGSARVVMDYIRPDPITGDVVPSKAVDVYVDTQVRVLRDPQVAVKTAERLGWFDSPDVLSAYSARAASDTRDLPSWVASMLTPRIGARMVDESNILEISYYGDSEELSLVAAEALREAYIASVAELRQQEARSAAESLEKNIARLRTELAELEAMGRAMERETGLSLGASGNDLAVTRLRRMVGREQAPVIAPSGPVSSWQARQLAAMNDELAAASKVLGPNNPELVRMKAVRDRMQLQAESREAVADYQTQYFEAKERASAALFAALKAEVLDTGEARLRMRLLTDVIKAREAEFERLATSLVRIRDVQSSTSTTLTPTGEAYVKSTPVFPNNALIFGGTGGIGLVLGSVMACLLELMGRRVRTVKHLEQATGVAVLAEIPVFRAARTRRGRRAPQKARSATDMVAA